ncbi:MAG TPA: hypothetical protein VKX49_21340 [Bryobacteraceae bacterium]|nr:hypothetical protein [Bryobacteraceae bacterium]
MQRYFETRPTPGHTLDVLQHLHLIAKTFAEMYAHRQTADYNTAIKWSRTDVLEKIQSVEAAFQSWRLIRNEDEAQNFLVTLLLKER